MDSTSRWVKNFRILTFALIFSGTLNVGFVAAYFFSSLADRQTAFSIALPKREGEQQNATLQNLLSQLEKLSFHELVSYLTNRDAVEEGYSKRDIALAALVSFHHFNLEKALSGPLLQKRTICLNSERKVEMFPGLTDDEFEAIVRFAYEEKWPLTAEGLFKLLKKWPEPKEVSLVQAFLITPEFHALNVLFQKTEAVQESAALLHLVLEGTWDILDRLAREQAQLLDLSVEKRRRLLLSYLASGSPTAAQLLLSTDFSFVAKHLEDRGILDLLALAGEKTMPAEKLCLDLLQAPRTDAVWRAAAERLYRYAGEGVPEPFDLKAAMARFAPASVSIPVPTPVSVAAALAPVPAPVSVAPVPAPALMPMAAAPFRRHVVKEGESLWKIARQYKVKVDELVKCNALEKDRLHPGMTLKIPPSTQGTGSEPPR